MRISVAFVIFVVLFKGIEPRPRTWRSYSYSKPTYRYYDSDSDSEDGFSSDDFSDDSDSDYDYSDDDDYDSWYDNNCPTINRITSTNQSISASCINGKFFINGKEIKNVKSTDCVEVIGNKLRVNGKNIRTVSPSNNSNNFFTANSFNNYGPYWSRANSNKCPAVTKINCYNVSHVCVNGQLYINSKKINAKPSDKVVIISNNLKINGKFIRRISSAEKNYNFGFISDEEGSESENEDSSDDDDSDGEEDEDESDDDDD